MFKFNFCVLGKRLIGRCRPIIFVRTKLLNLSRKFVNSLRRKLNNYENLELNLRFTLIRNSLNKIKLSRKCVNSLRMKLCNYKNLKLNLKFTLIRNSSKLLKLSRKLVNKLRRILYNCKNLELNLRFILIRNLLKKRRTKSFYYYTDMKMIARLKRQNPKQWFTPLKIFKNFIMKWSIK